MKKAFTLVEFIVSIAILLIIGMVGISQYKSSLGDARNTTRIGDINTTITYLKANKLNTGFYPNAQNSFNIFSGSTQITQQGFLNESITSMGINKTITDPLTQGYYMYSVLPNGGRFQIGASLEDNDEKNISGFQAYVQGDYENILGTIPSLLFATQTGGTFSSLSGSMILQKSKWNLPYDQTGKPLSSGKSYSEIINKSGVENKTYSGYKSCLEILEAGYNYGSGIYNISPNGKDKISVYCDMSSDGGGWTLAVRIKADGTGNHGGSGSYGTISSPTQGTLYKLSDAQIQSIVREGIYKLTCNTNTAFYKLSDNLWNARHLTGYDTNQMQSSQTYTGNYITVGHVSGSSYGLSNYMNADGVANFLGIHQNYFPQGYPSEGGPNFGCYVGLSWGGDGTLYIK